MNRLPLLPALALSLLPASATAAAVAPGDEQAQASASARSYELAIESIEAMQGAYGADLAEPLLGLGKTLQSQGRHEEALRLFKRGVHLARINDGLYSKQQIPLLQGEIASHVARGDYALADERQRYLYRVQLRSVDSGEARTQAFMQQAAWQYEAYRLGLGPQGYARLMNMWDLYRQALNEVIAREGETSPGLLPPLYGMLQTQYLISGYQWGDGATIGDDVRARQDLYRFSAYQAQSYEKGNAVLAAILSVEREQGSTHEHRLAAARALAMLGDWHLYHEQRTQAWQAYTQALQELDALGDAKAEVAALFADPRPLPDLEGLRPLPPVVDAQANPGAVLLEFGVSESGRVYDMERLDDNEALDGRANRLMRALRKTKFRPRFEAGQSVATENIIRAFDLQS